MEILERYLYAVGRWLPGKQKKDILAELESSIYDTLESKFGKKDSYSEEEVTDVIKELGSPWKVAAAYSGLADRLIGPELLPLYYTLNLIISGALVLGLTISFIVGLFAPDIRMIDVVLGFLKLIPQLIAGIATVVGFTTIIFAIIDRVVPAHKLRAEASIKKGGVIFTLEELDSDEKKKDEWSPKDLPTVPKGKIRIPRWEPILGIVFSVIAIVLFNFFRDKIGIYYTPSWGGDWQFVPILTEDAVKVFLPFWNLVWGTSIVFCIWQLAAGRWTLPLRITDLFRSFLDAAVIALMIRGPELIDIRLLLSNSSEGTREALTPIAEFLNYSIDRLLIIILILTGLGILGKLVNLFKTNTYEKPLAAK